MSPSYGLSLVESAVPISMPALRLVAAGIRHLWQRIAAADPGAEDRPLLLSYDVHPSPEGLVLIEVNTNAGGVLTALAAAREGNDCCADFQQEVLEQRLLALFERDLLGHDRDRVIAIVDDQLERQALAPEMQALAELMRPRARAVIVVDAAELRYEDGRLRHGDLAIDAIYWRSTDFLVEDPAHAAVRQALDERTVLLAPSPAAYTAIADKRRFLQWSEQPELARDAASGLSFRIAETLPMTARSTGDWYRERKDWVFKPVCGHASRGVYVGKSVSRRKLEDLPAADYLAQRYAPHPVLDRKGCDWKYDVRFFADRGTILAAAARVFQGQVMGLREPGSGFAPLRIDRSCCLIGALATAGARIPSP